MNSSPVPFHVPSIGPEELREVEAQHADQDIEQSGDNLGRLLAAPNGGKRLNAHQIIDAVLKALGVVVGGLLHLDFQIFYARDSCCAARSRKHRACKEIACSLILDGFS